jgi:hypothetical protein
MAIVRGNALRMSSTIRRSPPAHPEFALDLRRMSATVQINLRGGITAALL